MNVLQARLHRRRPDVLWRRKDDIVALAASDIGFAGASEADRQRWLNGFRRLLDGLDSRMQVVIETTTGSLPDDGEPHAVPGDFDEMRAADLAFADRIADLATTCRRSVFFGIDHVHAPRLEAALREIGVQSTRHAPTTRELFGQEQPDQLLHHAGWSRTWYVDRLPGTELEPG